MNNQKKQDAKASDVEHVVIQPYKGMKVVDSDGNVGTIKEFDDDHNIYVVFDDGKGFGLYCIDPNCPEHYGLIKAV